MKMQKRRLILYST